MNTDIVQWGSSDYKTVQPESPWWSSSYQTFEDKDQWKEEFYVKAMAMATSPPFTPRTTAKRVRRDDGYGHHGCKRSGLGIFNFLLFLVVLLGLLNSLLQSAMTMIMINGENVSLLQVII